MMEYLSKQKQLLYIIQTVDRCTEQIQMSDIKLIQSFIQMEKEPVKEEEKQKKKKWINPLRDRTRVVPFVVPDKEERMSALGSLAGEKWRVKKSLLAILDDFEPIEAPQPGDNLFQKEEDGQGFGLFHSKYRNHIDIEKEIIYIATFFSNVSKDTIQRIKKKAKAFFFGVKVKLYQFPKTNLENFDPMDGPNGQKYYDAAKINQYFSKHLPKNAYSIAIITNLLIYNGQNPTEFLEDKVIFGLGSIKDRTSLISFERIVTKYYGALRVEGEEDQSEENIEFLMKVVNHEICHTFAMKHCIYYECLMKGSNGYQEASSKEEHLCPICLRKLQSALNFDFVQRFEALGDDKSLMLAEKISKALNLQK